MFSRLTFIFWRYLFRFGLFKQVAELIFPVFFTLWATLLVEYSARRIPSLEHHAIAITALSSVVILFVVLWLHSLLLAHIFRGAFSSLIQATQKCHPVTQRFGANVLRHFLSEYGARSLLDCVGSLPKFLLDLESPAGRELSKIAYAMLLREAAEMAPDCHLATWEVELVPLSDVIDAKGHVTPEYVELFSSLTKLYQRIPLEENKCRVFIFKDQQHQTTVTSDTTRWEALLSFHRKWGFKKVYLCTCDVLKGAQLHHPTATLEDFVIYVLSLWVVKQAWVIGRDRETRLTRLHHDPFVMKHNIQLYQALCESSTVLQL